MILKDAVTKQLYIFPPENIINKWFLKERGNCVNQQSEAAMVMEREVETHDAAFTTVSYLGQAYY